MTKSELDAIAARKGIGRAVWLDETASTNQVASQPGYGHGDIVVAGAQTAGRGQRGNSWHAAPGDNLTFSLIVRPDNLRADRQFGLSMAAALAVSAALERFGIDCSVKWTNDVYVGDRKIAGILIENDIVGMNISKSVVGIGLNVNQRSFPTELPNPVSMATATGRRFGLGEVLEELYEKLLYYYGLLPDREDIIHAEYLDRLYRKEVPADYRLADGTVFQGSITGVRPTGELIVEGPNGTAEYLFREIEFIL